MFLYICFSFSHSLYNARTGRYKLLNNSVNFENDIKKIDLPVLAVSFQADKLAPQNAVKRLTSKLKNVSVNHHHFENCNLDHFNWINDNKIIVERIYQWIGDIS